jgi:hypothetical protein
MIKTCWIGCSLTWGEGFDDHDREIYVYDRVVCKHLDWYHKNFAKPGASNNLIFSVASQQLLTGNFDKVFVQWSALNRVWFFPGPDAEFFVNDESNRDFVYRELCIDSKAKKKFQDLLLVLNHDYNNILQLIDYCRILDIMAKHVGCDVFFINGLVPWTKDLEHEIDNQDLDNQFSSYTKDILDFSHRDDNENIKFFKILQEKFNLMPKHRWINLFESMYAQRIDLGPLGHHPGIRSHAMMAKNIIDFLKNSKV